MIKVQNCSSLFVCYCNFNNYNCVVARNFGTSNFSIIVAKCAKILLSCRPGQTFSVPIHRPVGSSVSQMCTVLDPRSEQGPPQVGCGSASPGSNFHALIPGANAALLGSPPSSRLDQHALCPALSSNWSQISHAPLLYRQALACSDPDSGTARICAKVSRRTADHCPSRSLLYAIIMYFTTNSSLNSFRGTVSAVQRTADYL